MTRQSKELKPLQKGQQFGRLTVIGLDHQEEYKRKDREKEYLYFYKFQCDCGNVCILNKKSVVRGQTQSCGCLQKEVTKERMTTHGKTKTKLFGIWQGIRMRCLVPKTKFYPSYGGRGITICDEWKDNFQTFYDWSIKNGYEENQKLSIDRIDNNKGYSPENCRWVTQLIQSRNTRQNVNITYNGKTQCISAWAEELGIREGLLRDRVQKQKMSMEEAISKETHKTYTYNGMTKTIKEWAEMMNLQPHNLYYRLNAGLAMKDILEKSVNHFLITYNNKTQYLNDWAKELNISKSTLRYRLTKGWSVEKAFNTPVKTIQKVKCIETNKIYSTIQEAAKDINHKPDGIYSCVIGRNPTAYGYHWEYITGES